MIDGLHRHHAATARWWLRRWQKDSPAAGKLEVGDVIESVKDAKGDVRAVKGPLDFVMAMRTLKVGDEAQIKVKRKAVAVKSSAPRPGSGSRCSTCGSIRSRRTASTRGSGGRRAAPTTPAVEDGEARIGWMTATGDPARPVTVAGADQYRGLFCKLDFIRRLLETGDYALAYLPPDRPKLVVEFPGSIDIPGRGFITRESLDASVRFNDPDRVRDPRARRTPVAGDRPGRRVGVVPGAVRRTESSRPHRSSVEARRLYRSRATVPDALRPAGSGPQCVPERGARIQRVSHGGPHTRSGAVRRRSPPRSSTSRRRRSLRSPSTGTPWDRAV